MKRKQIIYSILIVILIAGFITWIISYNYSIDIHQQAGKDKKDTIITEQKIDTNTLKTQSQILNSILSDSQDNVKIPKSTYGTIKTNAAIGVSKIKKESTVKDTAMFNSDKSETSLELQNQTNSVETIRTPPVISKFPAQCIYQGEKFPSIDLKLFVADSKDNPENIRWELNRYKNLEYGISPNNKLEIKLPNEDWLGIDTLILIAFNSADLSSSVKIVFEVREVDLINRYPIKPVKDVLVIGVEDILSLIVNPVKWDSDDFVLASSIITGTLLLTFVDKEIQQQIIGSGSYEKNALMNFGKFYGETSTSQIAGLGITFVGLTVNNKKVTRLGLEVFESYLIADRLNFLLKYIFGRERPSENKGDLTFNFFSGRSNNSNALPSGHATLAFSLSTVLSSCTDNDYLKALIFTPAFLTAASRVFHNVHWTSDVLLGGAIGYAVGSFLVNRHNSILKDNLSLVIDQQGRIGFIYKF